MPQVVLRVTDVTYLQLVECERAVSEDLGVRAQVRLHLLAALSCGRVLVLLGQQLGLLLHLRQAGGLSLLAEGLNLEEQTLAEFLVFWVLGVLVAEFAEAAQTPGLQVVEGDLELVGAVADLLHGGDAGHNLVNALLVLLE